MSPRFYNKKWTFSVNIKYLILKNIDEGIDDLQKSTYLVNCLSISALNLNFKYNGNY